MEDLKSRIHTLVNIMQAILGFIELERYKEALEQTKRATKELQLIAKRLSDTAIVLPKDAKVTIAVKPEKFTKIEQEIKKLDGDDDSAVVAIVPKMAIKVKTAVKVKSKNEEKPNTPDTISNMVDRVLKKNKKE